MKMTLDMEIEKRELMKRDREREREKKIEKQKLEQSLGRIEEVLTVLNEALQPSKKSTLSNYVQKLEKLQRVLLCIKVALKNMIEARVGATLFSNTTNWIMNVGELANYVRCQVQELVSQVDGGGGDAHEIRDKDQQKKVSNSSPPPTPLHSKNITILDEIRKTRKKLAHMLYGKPISGSQKTVMSFDDWRVLESARGSPSYQHYRSDKCFSRDEDINTVIHMLLEINGGDEQTEAVVQQPIVFSILGCVGIGKTTLAQLIFNDERVKNYFDPKVWVEDLHRSFWKIRESLHEHENDLKGKRLLLVVDGVRDNWDEVGDKWVELKDFLRRRGCAKESCILVTTRSEDVARKVGTSLFYYLMKPLPEDDCWSLFAERAFWGTSKHKRMELIEYSINFMRLGGGVPLFVNALGSYWRSLKARQMWKKHESQNGTLVIPSEIYDNVLHSLMDTYNSLPSASKNCFLICSLFPKNSWIEKKTLVEKWMALDSFWKNEEKCSQYFDNLLVKTSFFKDLERDEVDGSLIKCRMHAPAHDFVSFLAKKEFFTTRVHSISASSTVRHLSVVCIKDTASINDILAIDSTLQSLFIFGNPTNLELSSDMFDHFCNLRILDLAGSGIRELPDSLGKLHDLRYLNLSSTNVTMLPTSIRDLRFLEILKLSYSRIFELPKETSLLINLRQLEIEGTYMNCLPKGIERLRRLCKLSDFIIGGKRGCSIRELGKLKRLQGRLVISSLNKLSNGSEAKKAELNKKYRVKCLVLDGKKRFNNRSVDLNKHFNSQVLRHLNEKTMKFKMSKERVMEMVFEGLKPQLFLERLEIWNYIGHKFPSWMEKSLTSLVSLKLAKCGMVELLPCLGVLPSLKYLHIHGMGKLKHLGRELYEEGNEARFPKLECLTFEEMPIWEQWDLRVENREMPTLTKLLLCRCSMLLVLPCFPIALMELTLHDCHKLKALTNLPMALRTFTVRHCHMLKELPDLPAPMRKLVLVDCRSLSALPPLPKALQQLVLRNCPSLKLVECLPSTLRELGVSNLSILGAAPQLPDALKVLNICNYSGAELIPDKSLPHLEYLVLQCKDRWLRSLPNLPKLVSLKIMMSPELAALPNGLNQIKTLKTLNIHFCTKLRISPDELQQLTNIQKLCIVGCPHLIEQCQIERGLEWNKKAHVPNIWFDNKIQYNCILNSI